MSRLKNLGGKTLTQSLQSVAKNTTTDRVQLVSIEFMLIKTGASPAPADVTQCVRMDGGNVNAQDPILAPNCTIRAGRDGMLARRIVLNPGDDIQIAASEPNAIRVMAQKVFEEPAT